MAPNRKRSISEAAGAWDGVASDERQPRTPLDDASLSPSDGGLIPEELFTGIPVDEFASDPIQCRGQGSLDWAGFMAGAPVSEQPFSETGGINAPPRARDQHELAGSYLVSFAVFQFAYRERYWNPRSVFSGYTLESFLEALPLSLKREAKGVRLSLVGRGVSILLMIHLDNVDEFERVKKILNLCVLHAPVFADDPAYELVVERWLFEDGHHVACRQMRHADAHQHMPGFPTALG